MAAYQVPLGFYQDLEVRDEYRIDLVRNKWLLVVQDLFAPFFQFIKARFHLKYLKTEGEFESTYILLTSSAIYLRFGKVFKKSFFEMHIRNNRLDQIIYFHKNKKFIAQCINS